MSAFWTFLASAPLIVAGFVLLGYAIRKHLRFNAQLRGEAEREEFERDARNILNGARRPSDDEVNVLLVHLVDSKRLMDQVLDRTASDPVIEVTLRDLRASLQQESVKLEQRGIR